MPHEHKSFSAETQYWKNNRPNNSERWYKNYPGIPVDSRKTPKVVGVALITKSTQIVFCIKYIMYKRKTVKKNFKIVKNIFIYKIISRICSRLFVNLHLPVSVAEKILFIWNRRHVGNVKSMWISAFRFKYNFTRLFESAEHLERWTRRHYNINVIKE